MDKLPAPEVPMIDFPVDPNLFDMACHHSGFTSLTARGLKSNAIIGQAFKQLGVITIGRAKLLIADEQADRIIARMSELLDDDDLKAPLKIAAAKVADSLIGRRIHAAKQMIHSATVDMSDGAKPTTVVPSFMPRVNVVPAGHAQVIFNSPSNEPSKTQHQIDDSGDANGSG